MIKTLSKLRKEGNFLNFVKNIYKKIIANIILNGENLKLSHQSQVQGNQVPSHRSF